MQVGCFELCGEGECLGWLRKLEKLGIELILVIWVNGNIRSGKIM